MTKVKLTFEFRGNPATQFKFRVVAVRVFYGINGARINIEFETEQDMKGFLKRVENYDLAKKFRKAPVNFPNQSIDLDCLDNVGIYPIPPTVH